MEEDLYSGYEDENHALSGGMVPPGGPVRGATPSAALRGGTAGGQAGQGRLGTASRLNTGMGRSPIAGPAGAGFGPPGTGLRMGTAMGGTDAAARPMTAVKGAGYVSAKAPGGSRTTNTPLERPKGPSPAEQCRKLEREVHSLIEDAAALTDEGSYAEGLEKAREADTKETALQRDLEKHELRDQINVDLHFAVQICLAHCCHLAGLDQEALSIYNTIVKNQDYQLPGRLRVNMGNIFFERKQYGDAIKNYRMALDQIPASGQGQGSAGYDSVRCKMMRNIGIAFLQHGMYQDAHDNFEAVLKRMPDHSCAFNRLVCTFMVTSTVEQADALKAAFVDLLNVPGLDETEEELSDTGNYGDDGLQDEMRQRSASMTAFIVTAAKLIAPRISPGDVDAGFQWCVDKLNSSGNSRLASEVMMAKATHYMATGNIVKTVQVLKEFEKQSGLTRAKAATNLSFLHLLEGRLEEANASADLAKQNDEYNVRALVNKGNCLFQAADRNGALQLYEAALRNEPDCIEAIYNVGLAAKAAGMLDTALEQFLTINGILPNQVEVLYQIADVYYLKQEWRRAIKTLNLVYDYVGCEPGILARLGAIHSELQQEDEALNYYLESHQEFPVDMEVLSWLGAHYVKVEQYERAVQYFASAAKMQPGEAKWLLMVASCYRRTQNYDMAVSVYEQVHERFPENHEALRFLIHICTDLQEGTKLRDYQTKLAKLERLNTMQDAIPQPGQLRQNMDASAVAQGAFKAPGGGLGGGDLLPDEDAYQAQASGVRVVQATGGQKPGNDWNEEELGADLLPGLD